MALLFIDGFDHYATADITKKWNSHTSCSINASAGRRSGGALSMNFTVANAVKNVAQSASFVIGAAVYIASAITSAIDLFKILDAGSVQCAVRINPDLTLSVHRSGTVLTSGTSVTALSLTTFAYVEFKVTIADSISAGSCKVRINGVDVITVATGQDTKSTANAFANQVSISGSSGSGGGTCLLDDFYICDLSGSTNNDFLGDVRIDTLYPTSDGNYTAFTPSTGTDHYALVDETTPNTSDYNESGTVNNRDSYGLGNLATLASQTVYAVQVNAAVLKDDAGAKSVATFVRSSSTDGDGASTALGTAQVYVSQVFETNPNGSIAWTETTVNAMEAGVKVTA